MAEGDLERRTRRMDGYLIDGRQVFARAITNDDLARKDELDDEVAELRLRHARLAGEDEREIAHTDDGDEIVVRHTPGEIDECDDVDRRKELRAEAREIASQIRRLDNQGMSLFIEDEDGEPFPLDAVVALPFRVSSKLAIKASEYAYGVEDEEQRPTTAKSGPG